MTTFVIILVPFVVILAAKEKGFFIYLIAITFGLNQTYIFTGNSLLENARWIILGICVFRIVLKFTSRIHIRSQGLFDAIIMIFMFYAFVSALYSFDPRLTIQRAFSVLLLYVTVFWLFWDYANEVGVERLVQILYWYAASLFLAGIVGLALNSNVWTTDGRYRGILSNPNSIGLLAAVSGPLFIGRLINRRDLLSSVMLLVVLISAILSGSRNGALALLVGLSYLLTRLSLARIVQIMYVGFFIISLIYIYPDLDKFTDESNTRRIVTVNPASESISSGRFEFWIESWPIIEKRLWYGYGFGTEDTVGNVIVATHSSQLHKLGIFHNSYLGILYQLGLLGFALSIIPLLILLWKSLRTTSEHSAYITLTHMLQAIIIASLISGMFESWLFSIGNAFSLTFWTSVMLLVRNLHTEARSETQISTIGVGRTISSRYNW